MFGFELTLQDDTKVLGVIFPDQSCYAHESICDMWASVGDMLKELDDNVKSFQIIGPVTPVQTILQSLERDYQRKTAELDAAKRQLEQAYDIGKHELEQLQGDDIKFIKKTVHVGDEWPEGEKGCHVSKPTNVIHCTDILTAEERDFLQDLINRKGLKIQEVA